MASTKVGEVFQNEVEIEWRIPNFFCLPAQVGESIYSDTFTFRGATWHIKLYPNGSRNNAGYLSIDFSREDSGSPIRATFTLSLKSADGSLERLLDSRIDHYTGWGHVNPFKRSELIRRNAELAPSDCVTIVCLFKMDPEPIKGSEEVVEAAAQTPSEYRIEKLSRDLNDLTVSGENNERSDRKIGPWRVRSGQPPIVSRL